MPDFPIYSAVVSGALAVAAAASRFAGVPPKVAVVLVGSGVVVAGFAAYKPPARDVEGTVVQKASRRYVARLIRLAVGTAVIATATVIALLAVR